MIHTSMREKKRHDLPTSLPPGLKPGLWMVATPIGNLEDFSSRARLALEHADAILCEDTARTSNLLSAFGISKSMYRLDAHATPDKIEGVVARLKAGENFACVSDAGTPAVSDPGSALVKEARASGIDVTPIPGVSAVTALLSVSGFAETEFTFRGFFPRKKAEKVSEILQILESKLSTVFVYFESPKRLIETLETLLERLPQSEWVIGKELTKLHEKIFAGPAAHVFALICEEIANEGERGEWCFAIHTSIGPSRLAEEVGGADKSSDWVKALHCLLDAQVSASEAARQVSQHFGAPKKIVYEAALKLFGKKNSEGG